MLRRKAAFNPLMAVAIMVTVTMPMMTPSVVSTERIWFALIADHEILSPSRISVRKVMRARAGERRLAHRSSPVARRRR
jgi:hypothetical protein